MADPDDDSSSSAPPRSPPKQDQSSNSETPEKPRLSRPLSYTHVFPARPAREQPPTTSRSSDQVPRPSGFNSGPAPGPTPGPQTHHSFNSTNPFFSGLDWLLEASTKQSEGRRKSPVLLEKGPSAGSLGGSSTSKASTRPQESREKQSTTSQPSDKPDMTKKSSKDT